MAKTKAKTVGEGESVARACAEAEKSLTELMVEVGKIPVSADWADSEVWRTLEALRAQGRHAEAKRLEDAWEEAKQPFEALGDLVDALGWEATRKDTLLGKVLALVKQAKAREAAPTAGKKQRN